MDNLSTSLVVFVVLLSIAIIVILGVWLGHDNGIRPIAYYSMMTDAAIRIAKVTGKEEEYTLTLDDANVLAPTKYEIQKMDGNYYGMINTQDFFNKWAAGILRYGSNFNVDSIIKEYNGIEIDEKSITMKGHGVNGMIPGAIQVLKDDTTTNETIIYPISVKNITLAGNVITMTVIATNNEPAPIPSRTPHSSMADNLHTHILTSTRTEYGALKDIVGAVIPGNTKQSMLFYLACCP